jgi:hypothetical protein
MPLVKISTGGTGKKAIVVDGGKFKTKNWLTTDEL